MGQVYHVDTSTRRLPAEITLRVDTGAKNYSLHFSQLGPMLCFFKCTWANLARFAGDNESPATSGQTRPEKIYGSIVPLANL